MDASAAYDAINEFVKLAAERRTRPLADNQKARMELLDEGLRDAIVGAHPAPKRLSNPSPVKSTTPAHGVAPAKIEVKKASQALDQALELSLKDKSKLSSISAEMLPKSSYTPPAVPTFMADYYSDALVPARMTTADLPVQAVNSEGQTVDLDREVRVLLGLERPAEPEPAAPVQVAAAPASARSAPARAATPAPAAPAAAPPKGVQAIVHIIAGGTLRGRIDGFDPKAPELSLLNKDPSRPAKSVPMRDILAVFFGLGRGEAPSEAVGTGVVVKLVNDRDVRGISPDYSEGGDALTIVPTPKRGSVDRIWIPAGAVKSIELL